MTTPPQKIVMPANDDRLRFGVFMAPFHNPLHNAALALQRDLELCEVLDNLGYDEVWFGEHHSGGYETFPSPEMMIAAAAQRTHRIRLNTGVISLGYHHPLMVADRIAFLDHLTRGRSTIGFGPGALPNDAYMMGLDYQTLRPRMEEALEAILTLFDSDEPVDVTTDWFTLREARLHVKSYSKPRLPMAVAAAVSPAGPRLAGKHGLGLISFGSTSPVGVQALQRTWSVVEEQAEEHGQTVSRGNWSVVSMMHVAETEAQAIKEVEHGFDDFFRYHHIVQGDMWDHTADLSIADKAKALFEAGAGVIGTPEMAVQHIKRIVDLSGGVGAVLFFAQDWANREATNRSYELFAREVAPHFDGSIAPRINSYDWYQARRQLGLDTMVAGQQQAEKAYAAERAAKV